MIRIKDVNSGNLHPGKIYQLRHDREEVIELARDIFHDNPEARCEDIPVMNMDTEKVMYYLSWQTNMSKDVDEKMLQMFNPSINELWDYDYNDDRMDFDILERADVFLFNELEEYSYAITKIIQTYFPDKYVFFKDKRALWFFDESDHLKTIENDSELYNHYSFCLEKPIMTVKSDVLQFAPETRDPMNLINKKYVSSEIMVGLYWLTDMMHFGDKNPDKTFFLIKSRLGMMGLADLIKWTLYRAKIAVDHRKGKIIPVVDLSVKDDGNQFNGGDGTNAWTMFFEQITDIPLEEVYQSANVVRGAEQLFMLNPYIKEESLFSDHCTLFRRFLRLNEKAKNMSDELYEKVIPKDAKRILGVVGRGTDYNQSFITTVLNQPSGPVAFLSRVTQVFKEGNYDCIFLATEDANVFRIFTESPLKDRIVYVDQDRVDYNANENNDKFLIDIYENQKKDKYMTNLRYLSIITILSKCTSLIASTDCGAFITAVGLNDHKYEYVEVFMKADEKIKGDNK